MQQLTIEELRRAKKEAITRVEREFLSALMVQASNNVSRAARASGLRRSYLQRLLSKHDLRKSALAQRSQQGLEPRTADNLG